MDTQFSYHLSKMGAKASKQEGGVRDSKAIHQKELQRIVFENAKRFQASFVTDKRLIGFSPEFREKLERFIQEIFNHQDEFAKGNIVFRKKYQEKLESIYISKFPSESVEEKLKIKQYVNELMEKLQNYIEQKATFQPLAVNPDPVKREQEEREAAPAKRRAEAQEKATRRWRTFQAGGFLEIFKQQSEEPSVIPRKRLRRTRKRKAKPTSGYFDF
jgi:hypothetical protein